MYYIERIPMTNATFLAGSIAEPAPGETEWVSGAAITKGQERIRSGLHRVFKAAADIASSTVPPEEAPTVWQDMRPTRRHLPFGPNIKSNGLRVYQSIALTSTTENLEYRLGMRYANAIALYGLRGARWRVKVFDKPESSGGVLQVERTDTIKAPALGFWDYGFGQRIERDRILITGLPIFPNAEIRITVEGTGDQMRALSQCEVGKLQFLPGDWGGVLAGLSRTPRVISESKQETDGTTTVAIYGNTYDMRGTVLLKGVREDAALSQLRGLLLKGVAFAPTLAQGFNQSLNFGLLKSARVTRPDVKRSEVEIEIEGLPT